MNTEEQHENALKEQANKGSKMIWVTFRKEGIHKYPAALDDPKLATGDRMDVSFLWISAQAHISFQGCNRSFPRRQGHRIYTIQEMDRGHVQRRHTKTRLQIM